VEVGWTLPPDWWGRGLAPEGGLASIRCWRVFSMSPRTCVNNERSTVDSAPGAMMRLASRKAQTSSSARLTRPTTSRSWASMNLRLSLIHT